MKKIVLITTTILGLTIVSCNKPVETETENCIDTQECVIDTQCVKKNCDTTVCKDTLKK
jgi:hypothetical protein